MLDGFVQRNNNNNDNKRADLIRLSSEFIRRTTDDNSIQLVIAGQLKTFSLPTPKLAPVNGMMLAIPGRAIN
jgi:hypothetical protein